MEPGVLAPEPGVDLRPQRLDLLGVERTAMAGRFLSCSFWLSMVMLKREVMKENVLLMFEQLFL